LTNENSEACFWREGWERLPIDVVRKNRFESRLAWLMGSRHSRGCRHLIFCHGILLLMWRPGVEEIELRKHLSEDARDERSKPLLRISTDSWCPQYRFSCMADLSSCDDLRRYHQPLAAKVLTNAFLLNCLTTPRRHSLDFILPREYAFADPSQFIAFPCGDLRSAHPLQ